MAANFRFSGGECCCCKDTVTGSEQRAWEGSAFGNIQLKRTNIASEFREIVYTHNMQPASSPLYSDGTCAPEWQGKRVYYTYQLNQRSGGGALIGSNSVIRWWNLKDSAGTAGDSPLVTGDVGTVTGFYVDAMATHADEQKIYFVGYDYPYPDGSVDYSYQMRRIDYDGSNMVTLDTVPAFRTGSSTPFFAGAGCMMMNRPENRLYYVVAENVATASAADWIIDIRYRDLTTFAETTIYSKTFPRLGTQLGETWVRMLNSISFDFEDKKIYWVESYRDTVSPFRFQFKIRRANYDGTDDETLLHAVDPFQVSFARYSNLHKKVIYSIANRLRTASNRLPGVYVADKDDLAGGKIVALENVHELTGAPYPSPFSSFLWCGYEVTGPHAVC